MARPRRVDPPIPNGFIASASRLPTVQRNYATSTEAWMSMGWEYYNTIGELRFIANWVGNVMSRAILRVVHKEENEFVPLTSGPAAESLDAYFGGPQGQSQMLQATGVNLTIPGECYHVMLGADEEWVVLPSGAVTQQDKQVYATYGGRRHDIGPSDLAIRVWVPHPRDPDVADSPVRSSLQTLSEIRRINEHVSSQLDSRLAGAGILFMPSEIQFAATQGTDPQSNQADAFMAVLGDVMTTGIKDRGSAAAIVPIVVTAPGDSLEKVQLLHFWTPLDAATISMRESAIRRLALGMDTPPEVLLGVSDTNHWGAWMVDEAAIKAHLEPRLSVVSHAITTAYLRPSLVDEVPDPENYYVMADTSQIRLKPNRSNEALELYDRAELSGDALRRETGFQPEDHQSDTEFMGWLLRKIATGSTSPEQTSAALKELGVNLFPDGQVPDGTNKEPPDAMRTDTSRRRIRKPDKRVLDISQKDEPAEPSALLAASEALVIRALERAGNKLCDAKARANGLGSVDPRLRYLQASGNVDNMLEGAWTSADVVLKDLHTDTPAVITLLDFYVRGLLTMKREHSRNALDALLKQLESVL